MRGRSILSQPPSGAQPASSRSATVAGKLRGGGRSLEMWERIGPALQTRGINRSVLSQRSTRRYGMPEFPLDALSAALRRPALAPTAEKTRLIIAERPNPFVSPKLQMSGIDSLATEIIFVEASAAVGKSTIAKFLSSSLGIPMLDLSKIPVSTGSLHTLLLGMKNETGVNPVAAFHAGDCPIFIDALDEGRLLSGETGIESFLQTTAELLLENNRNQTVPKLVFFGRYESIDLARNWIELCAPAVRFSTIQIGFFDRNGAWELIQAYAKAASLATVGSQYLQHEESAKNLITAYFNAIEAALGLNAGELWVKDQGKAFAGYAPVLAAVGSLLAGIDNFVVVTNRIKDYGGQEAWGVIETVLNEILRREQGKLVHPLSVQCKTALPPSVYDPEEQLALLAQYVDGQPLEGARRVTLPSQDMAKYQDMIELQLPDHPFIRQKDFGNSVLGSAVLANAIYRGQKIPADRLIDLSRQPFIWRSISRLLESSTLIEGEYVGYILNSYWNDRLTDEASSSRVYMRPSDSDGAVSVRIPTSGGRWVSFEAVLPLKFYGIARDCDADIPGKVIFEGSGARGSGKSLRLHEFTLISEVAGIEADTVRLDGNVWMEAQELSAPPHLRLIRNGAKVGWGGQFARQYPWSKEIVDLRPPYETPPEGKLSSLVRECVIRFPAGITLILNPDFSPVRGDPQTRWITRHFSTEFPRLITLMHDYALASSDPTFGAGSGKVKVRFSTMWVDLLRALDDSSTSTIPIDFINQARREID